MTITREKKLLSIGADFVDCMIGPWKSSGEVEINGTRYRWRAVVDCVTAEHFIRQVAKSESLKVPFFSSQASI